MHNSKKDRASGGSLVCGLWSAVLALVPVPVLVLVGWLAGGTLPASTSIGAVS